MGNIDQERVGSAQIGKKVVCRLEAFRIVGPTVAMN